MTLEVVKFLCVIMAFIGGYLTGVLFGGKDK